MTRVPTEQLLEGVGILDPLLTGCGFVFRLDRAGRGSGGTFAAGRYERGDRFMELHYRWGLGLVVYHVAGATRDHNTYMKLLGVFRDSAYAAVALDGTSDGFHRLLADLERFGQDFLSGDGQQFQKLARQFAADPRMFSGFRAMDSFADT